MEEKRSPTREPRRNGGGGRGGSPQRNRPRVPASGARSTYNNWASHQSRGASNSGSNGSQTGSNVDGGAAAHTDSNRAGYRRAAAHTTNSSTNPSTNPASTTSSASNSSLPDTGNSPPMARAGSTSTRPAPTARQGLRFRRRVAGEDSQAHRASTDSHRHTGPPLNNPFLSGPRSRRSRQPPTSGMTSDPSSSDSSPSDLPSDFLGSLMMPSSMSLPRASFITSLEGTEAHPIHLSPDSPSDLHRPPTFLDLDPPTFLDLDDSPTNTSGTPGMSDEEFARRLQQEEWETASTFSTLSHEDMMMPAAMPAGLRGLHQPYRPAHRQGRQATIPRSSGPSFTARNAGGPGMDFMSMLGPLLMGGATRGHDTQERNLPFLVEMLRASGMLQMMQVENMLDSGTGGDYEQLLALAEQIGEVNKGLSPEEITQMPTRLHKGEKLEGAQAGCEDQCSICLTDYQEGDSKRGLPCTHDFHTACVDQWLATNPTCPVCRADLKPKDTSTSTS